MSFATSIGLEPCLCLMFKIFCVIVSFFEASETRLQIAVPGGSGMMEFVHVRAEASYITDKTVTFENHVILT